MIYMAQHHLLFVDARKRITGMNPKASLGNRFRSKLWGIPSA